MGYQFFSKSCLFIYYGLRTFSRVGTDILTDYATVEVSYRGALPVPKD
jgi:hypothetical protein